MGGKSSKMITENDIKNNITTTITNNTKNITDVLNKTVNTTTTNIVNKNAAAIQQSTGGTNMLTMGDLNVGGASNFEVDQNLSVTATNSAIIQLIQSSEAMSKLGNDLTAAVANAVKNDSTASASLAANNAITEKMQQSGGLGGMVNAAFGALQGMMGDLTGGESETQMITRISNAIDLKIENTTVNENYIKNVIENTITNNIQNVNSQTCQMQTSGQNIMALGNVNIQGTANVRLAQSQAITALNNCVIKMINTNKLAEEIQSASTANTASTTSNTNSAGATMTATNSISKETTVAPGLFTAIANNMMIIIIVFAVLGALGGMGYLFLKMNKGSDGGDQGGYEE